MCIEADDASGSLEVNSCGLLTALWIEHAVITIYVED